MRENSQGMVPPIEIHGPGRPVTWDEAWVESLDEDRNCLMSWGDMSRLTGIHTSTLRSIYKRALSKVRRNLEAEASGHAHPPAED